MYKVFRSEVFDKKAKKLLSNQEFKYLDTLISRLKVNPFIGRHLSYYFLREYRIEDKRIYYLIYEDICLVLLITTSDKKTQQATIDMIKENLGDYKKYAHELHKNNINTP